jgi:hypothetical protein
MCSITFESLFQRKCEMCEREYKSGGTPLHGGEVACGIRALCAPVQPLRHAADLCLDGGVQSCTQNLTLQKTEKKKLSQHTV